MKGHASDDEDEDSQASDVGDDGNIKGLFADASQASPQSNLQPEVSHPVRETIVIDSDDEDPPDLWPSPSALAASTEGAVANTMLALLSHLSGVTRSDLAAGPIQMNPEIDMVSKACDHSGTC